MRSKGEKVYSDHLNQDRDIHSRLIEGLELEEATVRSDDILEFTAEWKKKYQSREVEHDEQTPNTCENLWFHGSSLNRIPLVV